jgi:hypothetical protein
MWFLHCHIDLHNTNGMGMVIDEGESKASPPEGFPTCRSFLYNGKESMITCCVCAPVCARARVCVCSLCTHHKLDGDI